MPNALPFVAEKLLIDSVLPRSFYAKLRFHATVANQTESFPDMSLDLAFTRHRNCQRLFALSFGPRTLMFVCAISASFLTGCQRWPGSQVMRQYQQDSDRLLSEFRSQKKRAEDLEARNQQLEQRLSESEKLIARMQGNPSSRIGSNTRGNGSIQIGESNSNRSSLAISENSSSRSNATNRVREGLPDADRPTPGYLTGSSSNGDVPSLGLSNRANKDLKGDPSQPPQWRPRPANR